MFKIGDFSRIARVPISVLRYYADIDLLEPAQTDAATSYRYYSFDQLPRLNRIMALKDLGLTLPQIKQWLDDSISLTELQAILRLREAELEQEIADAQDRLNRVKGRLRLIQHEDTVYGDVVLKNVEAQTVLAVREVIALPDDVALLIRETSPIVLSSGLDLLGAPMTIFHDVEFKAADLDVEIAYPVHTAKSFPLRDNRSLAPRELEDITAASILHVGSYDHFMDTYTALARWIDANGYQVAGQPREIYLRPPSEAEPALTEIQMPVIRSSDR